MPTIGFWNTGDGSLLKRENILSALKRMDLDVLFLFEANNRADASAPFSEFLSVELVRLKYIVVSVVSKKGRSSLFAVKSPIHGHFMLDESGRNGIFIDAARNFRCLGIHIHSKEKKSRPYRLAAFDFIRTHEASCDVVAGDFNAYGKKQPLALLRSSGFKDISPLTGKTCLTGAQPHPIDHAFKRLSSSKPATYSRDPSVMKANVSDHLIQIISY